MNALDATVELLATLTDAAAEAWAAADVAARLEEWRRVVTRPDLVDGVGLIVGIDRLMFEARALTTFSGKAVATLLVTIPTPVLAVTR